MTLADWVVALLQVEMSVLISVIFSTSIAFDHEFENKDENIWSSGFNVLNDENFHLKVHLIWARNGVDNSSKSGKVT